MDGVMNRGGHEESTLNPELIAVFKAMLPRTGAQVVISSSWKHNTFMLDLIRGSVFEFIDHTPYVPVEGISDSTRRRGVEIQAWLDAHPEVTRYAIIDDTGIMFEHQLPNFFKTEPSVGLTREIAERVIHHFSWIKVNDFLRHNHCYRDDGTCYGAYAPEGGCGARCHDEIKKDCWHFPKK